MTSFNEITFPVHDPHRIHVEIETSQYVEMELTAAAWVPRCCQAEAPQPSWGAVVSIPVEAAGMGAEQGQRW